MEKGSVRLPRILVLMIHAPPRATRGGNNDGAAPPPRGYSGTVELPRPSQKNRPNQIWPISPIPYDQLSVARGISRSRCTRARTLNAVGPMPRAGELSPEPLAARTLAVHMAGID